MTVAISQCGFGTRTHVNPYFEPLQLLHLRNYSVLYAAPITDLKFADDHKFIEQYELKGLDYGTTDLRLDYDGVSWVDKMIIYPGIQLTGMFNVMHRAYSNISRAYDDFFKSKKVDFLICDFLSPACMDSADRHNIPYMITGQFGYNGYGSGIIELIIRLVCTKLHVNSPIKDMVLNFLYFNRIESPLLRFKTYLKSLIDQEFPEYKRDNRWKNKLIITHW